MRERRKREAEIRIIVNFNFSGTGAHSSKDARLLSIFAVMELTVSKQEMCLYRSFWSLNRLIFSVQGAHGGGG